MGRDKGAKAGSLPARPTGLRGAGQAAAGQALPGLWAEDPRAILAPSRRAPLTRAALPGRFSLLFVLFCFSSSRSESLARGTAPSLLQTVLPRACVSPPGSADLSEPRSRPRPPPPCPLLPRAPITAPGNRPRRRRGPKPAQVRTPGPGRPGRGPLAAGLGGAVPGADAAPESPRAAPRRDSWCGRPGVG